jgi:hypothetical protein
VLGFDVAAAERNWHAARHPFYEFMVRTYHPDIQVFAEPGVQPARVPLALAA